MKNGESQRQPTSRKEDPVKTYRLEQTDNGEELTMTHQQVEDSYKDGTIDMMRNGGGK